MNNISNLEALERLCILVESAGIDIAPNFYQYADIAFGIANAVGEAGRIYFHRLCAVCPKYQYDNAERIFTNALKTGRGENGLGTVFHHAEQTGIHLGELKRFSPNPTPPPLFLPRARVPIICRTSLKSLFLSDKIQNLM